MKLAVIFLGIFAISTASPRGFNTRTGISHKALISENTRCNGPECPGGCCPEFGYVCCENGNFCAATIEACPYFPNKMLKVNNLKKVPGGNSRCNGPECPGGCCPESGYVCCEDGNFCAATTKDCPHIPSNNLKGIIWNKETRDNSRCNGPECPGGCCPESGYVCCESGDFCAATIKDCPNYPKFFLKFVGLANRGINNKPVEKYIKKLEVTKQECDGTTCPRGCCSGVHDWFCCEDGIYCVISPEYCRGLKKDMFLKLVN